MLVYTTIEAIQRRLSGRLQIGGGGQPYGKTAADENLLEQIGTQVEARVEATLRGVYRFPLAAIDPDNVTARPIVASIVEKGVVCELSDVHFFQGEDGNSYGREMCRQFKAELEQLKSKELRLVGEVEIYPVAGAVSDYSGVALRVQTEVEQIQW